MKTPKRLFDGWPTPDEMDYLDWKAGKITEQEYMRRAYERIHQEMLQRPGLFPRL